MEPNRPLSGNITHEVSTKLEGLLTLMRDKNLLKKESNLKFK
jgi:hypothetical protein